MKIVPVLAAALLVSLIPGAAPAADELSLARARLVVAKAEAAAAVRRAAGFERSADRERDAATRARAAEDAVAARVARAEADLAAAQARVAIVGELLARQRAELGARQQPVARLLAALQSLAGRPTVAAIVQPGSVDDLVHVRAVLGSVLPVVRARTADVRADLDRTRALEANAAVAARSLVEGRATLVAERRRLTALRTEHAERARALNRNAIAEGDRALAMGEAARDLVDRMDLIGGTQTTLAALDRLPGPPASDAVAPASAAPAYRLPVAGRVETGLGEISDAGVRSRGVTLAVRASALVVAPAAGRVVFAGPFRGYGAIVILDHGDGWSSAITGLAGVDAAVGAQVAAGAVLGHAPASADARVTVELRRRGRPVDIAALVG